MSIGSNLKIIVNGDKRSFQLRRSGKNLHVEMMGVYILGG